MCVGAGMAKVMQDEKYTPFQIQPFQSCKKNTLIPMLWIKTAKVLF